MKSARVEVRIRDSKEAEVFAYEFLECVEKVLVCKQERCFRRI